MRRSFAPLFVFAILGLTACSDNVVPSAASVEPAPAPVAAAKEIPLDPALSFSLEAGREFSADGFVHRELARDAELDPDSASFVANLRKQIEVNFEVASVDFDGRSPVILKVPGDLPTVAVKVYDPENPAFEFPPLQDQWLEVPLPADFAQSLGDSDLAVIYQPDTGRIWELGSLKLSGQKARNSAGEMVDEWEARWGGRLAQLAASPGFFPAHESLKFGVTASGIALLAGIVTIEDQARGEIDHVVGLQLPDIAVDRVSQPAQRTNGTALGFDAIPMGTIFRLPADLELDALEMDPYARMIAKAVQKHGMVVWDSGGEVGFRAENPGGKYGVVHPYWDEGGLLKCPAAGPLENELAEECRPDSDGRLRGFPWEKLQALLIKEN